MMTTGPRGNPLIPGKQPHDQERVESFARWVREHFADLPDLAPPRTPLLIVLDEDADYVENPFSKTLTAHGIDYDVLYVSAKTTSIPAHGYSYVLVPQGFPAALQSKIRPGRTIIVEEPGWFDKIPSNTILRHYGSLNK
jgi:hypothetical protein